MDRKKSIFVIIPIVIIITVSLFFYFNSKQDIRIEIVALKYPARVDLTEGKKVLDYIKDSPKQQKTRNDLSYWYLLSIYDKSEIKQYYFNSPDYLYDSLENEEIAAKPELKTILEGHLAGLVVENPFGAIMSWEEVNKIFPRMAKARLRDLETGLSFNIQRRGGSSHADIQPLTSQDTAVFKNIYNGRWSWRRRAAVLEKDGFQIAASMNGMPHGQGAINGNNFPGHSCLHFYGTKTHSGNLDLAHQLMVWKSAGRIEDFLKEKSGVEMVEVALTAIAQNDPHLVTLSFLLNDDVGEILDYMDKIASLKIHSITQGDSGNEFLVKIEWDEMNSGKNYKKEFVVYLEEKDTSNYLIKTEEVVKYLVRNK